MSAVYWSTCPPTIWQPLDQYIGQYANQHATDKLVDRHISVKISVACWSRCQPIYRPRGAEITQDQTELGQLFSTTCSMGTKLPYYSASLHRPPIKVKVHRSMTFTLQFAPRRRKIPHHKQLAALNKFTLRRNDHPLVSKLQWRPLNFESEGLC